MSKVIHLGTDAHKTAKRFCKQHGLRMTDWVATLVDEAIANHVTPIEVASESPKKKVLQKLAATPQADEPQLWERAPFWKGKRRARG
jgi:antitoxin component of RelBE/YafQ-DinJ toxin-antitoxin module